ncbi:cell division protein FtsK [Anoxybacillus gonensis]|nr:DNA translocase FtsK [Anoxybacillus gonensis]AKS38107.1 cell division protein FtsK [Anoxybacillus gonensis]KGP60831.1 cell division protein FtsK [Anoxybacillus gonensis]MCX8046411.1 DNA translocase FtsK [Anoxybacillus gonensis]MDO0877223.1 DNA translocase FtsK [Anoxybacillus gonensis]
MGKKNKRRTNKQDQWKKTLRFEFIGLTMLACTVIAMANVGAVGRSLVFATRFFMGEWYIVALLGALAISLYVIWKRAWPPFFQRVLVGLYLIVLSLLLFSHEALFHILSRNGKLINPSIIRTTWELFWKDVRGESGSFSDLGGGMLGALLYTISYYLFDQLGTKWIASLLMILGVLLLTGKTLRDTAGKGIEWFVSFMRTQTKAVIADVRSFFNRPKKEKQPQTHIEVVTALEEKEKEEDEDETIVVEGPVISNFNEGAEEEKPIVFTQTHETDYALPPIDLLSPPKAVDQSREKESIYENARKLEKTFQSFGVKAKVTKVHIGPAVTRYEVYPDVGVKVSKIVSLSDDLALALAAKDIRIEAPIPGKSAIGIEVPNEEIAMVSLREVLEAKEADKREAKLLIGLGRDISGQAVLAELNKMPHLLVAGATGSGKSVCINAIIVSLLMRTKPHEVKMMMIDPKMVELSVYNGIPHLLSPVVTDPKKASQALKKVVSEMERRYELFSHTGTRNIEGYNEYIERHNETAEVKQPLLPYIVVIVDELADLMMVASSDVEDSITRLAQMARAAGIHLIIATQRPSVDVITGVIKANIPSRIAFSVSSQTDSRTILDMGGAEKLLGRGDMLFLPVGASKPVRVQGAFVSDQEVENVVQYVISQQKAQYEETMIAQDDEPTEAFDDELFDEAVQLVIDMQSASVSMLQRRFRIGYNRAARLIDAMEARGIVGPYEGSKPRAVLVSSNDQAKTS